MSIICVTAIYRQLSSVRPSECQFSVNQLRTGIPRLHGSTMRQPKHQTSCAGWKVVPASHDLLHGLRNFKGHSYSSCIIEVATRT
jgi:hypothetical protein